MTILPQKQEKYNHTGKLRRYWTFYQKVLVRKALSREHYKENDFKSFHMDNPHVV